MESFTSLYAQWQAYINRPQIRLRSNTGAYTDCKPFRDMVALGKPALPLLMEKLKDGNASGWKESQFFLWHAVREISGTDLPKDKPAEGEQEAARLYITWWNNQPK